MIPAWYKPKKKFMQLAIAEAKRARDRRFSPTGMPKTVQLRGCIEGSGKNAGADGVEVDVSSFCDGKAALWEAALCVSASLARRYLPLHLYGRGFGEFKAQCGLGR